MRSHACCPRTKILETPTQALVSVPRDILLLPDSRRVSAGFTQREALALKLLDVVAGNDAATGGFWPEYASHLPDEAINAL